MFFSSLSLLLVSNVLAIPGPEHVFQLRNAKDATVSTFENDQVLRLQLATQGQIDAILKAQDSFSLDTWRDIQSDGAGTSSMDVRVPSAMAELFKAFLDKRKIQHEIMIPDVQALVDREAQGNKAFASSAYEPSWLDGPIEDDPFFAAYQTVDAIKSFLDVVVAKFPALAESVVIGQTYEGRPIEGVRIRSSSNVAKQNKIVYHGGQHAREHIGVAVNLYFIRQLVTQYGIDDSVTTLVDAFDFTIIPVLNVDGYLYTFSKNRMWRKNRQPNGNGFCVGTDPNRNWDSAFGKPGASDNPCSEAYRGPSAFSAPEPKAVADYILKLNKEEGGVISYTDFHAYSQLWMFPYGYSCNTAPKNAAELQKVGNAAAAALKKVNGVSFKVGGVCRIIYQASGGSLDWTYDQGNVPYSFAVELRDTGKYGFVLPPEFILPSGKETMAAITAANLQILETL